MDTYYAYREVKAMIARKLMTMDGWKVYGYKPDKSDFMTDYYDPANWDGVAEKNGYILCVNVYGKREPYEVIKTESSSYDESVIDKINKLKSMTVERGASLSEQQSAEEAINRIRAKMEESAANVKKVVTVIPGHMENPPRANWHLEKNGVYVLKGNGILKYSSITNYYEYPHYSEDMEKFRTLKREEYRKYLIDEYANKRLYAKDRIEAVVDKHMQDLEKDLSVIKDFDNFMNRIDSACGNQIGDETFTYETVKKKKKKKENKVRIVNNGEVKEGQCFILNTSFNYGRSKGYVYRIHERKYEDGSTFYANKLNPKLTKECTGISNPANYWFVSSDFKKWIDRGNISWCEIATEEVIYEVDQVVRKSIKSSSSEADGTGEKEFPYNLTFELSEDVDTRTGEKIFLVKIMNELCKEDYIRVNKFIKEIGGYYSRFKHAFLFAKDPSAALRI